MKEKIIIFIAGLLLGSILSTASIYVYTLANKSNSMQMPSNNNQMNNENTQPEMPNNQNSTQE